MIKSLNSSTKGWRVPCLLSITAIYTPFAVATGWAWLYAGCPHCVRTLLKLLAIAPGEIVAVIVALMMFRRNIDIHPIIAGLLSAAIVGIVAWLTRRSPWVRWPSLVASAGLSAYGAMALYALVRA